MLKLLIIDLDGTLVDSKLDIYNALNISLDKFNIEPVSLELVSRHVGIGITPIIKDIVPDEIFQEFTKVFEVNYINNIANETRLYQGWEEVLDGTHQIKKVILSNKAQKFCDSLIAQLKLNKYFEKIFGGESFIENKPSPLPIYEIAKLFEVSLGSTLIVGDTVNDINAGKAAGIRTCGVSFGYSTLVEVEKLSPDYIVSEPIELLKVFEDF